jgi:hypothetical protein
MKRTRYDSEYERVRREAGVGQFPEPIDFSKPVDLGRVEAAHDDFKERMAAFAARDAEEAAKRKASADELSRRANASALAGEYRTFGLAPPLAGGDGAPRVSLSMLLSIGWTIAKVEGAGNVLVRPPPAVKETKEQRMAREKDMNT